MKKLLILLLWLPTLASAKKKEEMPWLLKNYNLQVQVMSAGIGLPPHIIDGRVQPGLQGALASRKKNNHGITYQIGLGYFAHRSLQRIAYLKAGIQYILPIGTSFSIQPNLNVYALGVRRTNREFQFVNGTYEEIKRTALNGMPTAGLDAIIPLAQSILWRYSLLLGYEFGVQYPFSALSSTLPIQPLKFGVQLQRK